MVCINQDSAVLAGHVTVPGLIELCTPGWVSVVAFTGRAESRVNASLVVAVTLSLRYP